MGEAAVQNRADYLASAVEQSGVADIVGAAAHDSVLEGQWSRWLANWAVLRVLLALTIALAVISIGVSSWQTDANAGDFQLILDLAKLNWSGDICESMPYQALRPFRFTFTAKGVTYSSPAYCPWPQSKTIYRIVLAIVQALSYSLFLVNRFGEYSIAFASPVHFVLAFLWWSALVLDTQSLSASSAACASNFGEGTIAALSKSRDLQLVCNSSLYGATNAIDFFMFSLTFLIFRIWSQCPAKYGLRQEDLTESHGPGRMAEASAETGANGSKRLSSPASWWRASENTRLSELFPRNSVQLAGGNNIALAHAPRSASASASDSKATPAQGAWTGGEYDSDAGKGKGSGSLSWFMRWWLSIGRYLERLVGSEESSDEALDEVGKAAPFTAARLDTDVPSGTANRLAIGPVEGTVAINPLKLSSSGGYSLKNDHKPVFTPPLKPPKPPAATPPLNPFADAVDDDAAEAPAQAPAQAEAPPPEPSAPPPPLPFLLDIAAHAPA